MSNQNKIVLKQQRLDIGLCGRCGNFPLETNKTRCKVCLQKAWNAVKIIVDKRKSNGLCLCGKRPPVTGKLYCKECRKRLNELCKRRQTKKIESGLCLACELPATKGRYCQEHWLRQSANKKEKIRKRRENGLCERCGSNDICTGKDKKQVVCEICLWKQCASRRLGAAKRWVELKELLERQKVCPYTGTELKVGVNISVDHIVPKAAGGKNDITNIQFVYCNDVFDVNRMKGEMSHVDFIEAIRIIFVNLQKVAS